MSLDLIPQQINLTRRIFAVLLLEMPADDLLKFLKIHLLFGEDGSCLPLEIIAKNQMDKRSDLLLLKLLRERLLSP